MAQRQRRGGDDGAGARARKYGRGGKMARVQKQRRETGQNRSMDCRACSERVNALGPVASKRHNAPCQQGWVYSSTAAFTGTKAPHASKAGLTEAQLRSQQLVHPMPARWGPQQHSCVHKSWCTPCQHGGVHSSTAAFTRAGAPHASTV
eukprot:1157423-Pelagomonas_calceolata.AAC.1